jgi:hypothetical protein
MASCSRHGLAYGWCMTDWIANDGRRLSVRGASRLGSVEVGASPQPTFDDDGRGEGGYT